jgi:hypothetical protein
MYPNRERKTTDSDGASLKGKLVPSMNERVSVRVGDRNMQEALYFPEMI